MNKHSEAPWSLCGDGRCSCKTVWTEHHPIATIVHGEWGDEYPSLRLVGDPMDRKAEAYMEMIEYGGVSEEAAYWNARLIVMAPRMLALIRTLTETNDEAKEIVAFVDTPQEQLPPRSHRDVLADFARKKP